VERDDGQTEFFVTDYDGFSHCFGVDTRALARALGPIDEAKS
jgi:hypothetical protein